jgi:dTDP-4-dehydrorhamnose reductase
MRDANVLVLGASGMLGSMVVDVLARDAALHTAAIVRDPLLAGRLENEVPEVDWKVLDVERAGDAELSEVIGESGWVVNAIGITKPLIDEADLDSRARAIRVNADFPHRLARLALAAETRVLQIATDCVYSGARGRYREADAHDASDVYGMTKSLGEAPAENVHHLRASIIGPEPAAHRFLLDWLVRQPRGARLKGFTNHLWNGVTTLHFARIAGAIVRGGDPGWRVQHLVPGDVISKCDLLRVIATRFARDDIVVEAVEVEQGVDRSLATDAPEINAALWRDAGYATPPAVACMVDELSGWKPRWAEPAGSVR